MERLGARGEHRKATGERSTTNHHKILEQIEQTKSTKKAKVTRTIYTVGPQD